MSPTWADLMDGQRRAWSESAFDAELVTQAAPRGWDLTAHAEKVTMKARGGRMITKTPMGRGFPDRIWCRGGLVIMVELKDEKGGPSDDQRRWLTGLSGLDPADRWGSRGDVPTHQINGGLYVGLWRPRHWSHVIEVFDAVPWTARDEKGRDRPLTN